MAVQPKRIVTPNISTSDHSGFPMRYVVIFILISAWTWAAYQFGRDGSTPDIIDSPEQVEDSGLQLEQLRAEYKALKRRADAIGKSGQEMSDAQKMATEEISRLQDERTSLIKEVSTLTESANARKLQLDIKDISIQPGKEDGTFQYKVTIKPLNGVDGVATGMMRLIISGNSDGNPLVVEEPKASDDLENGHRVFSLSQDLVGAISVPDGFEPEKVTLELMTGNDSTNPLIHKYSWSDVLAEKKPGEEIVDENKKLLDDLERENLALKIKLAKAETPKPIGEGVVAQGDGGLQEWEQQRDTMAKEIEQLKQKVAELRGKFKIKDIGLNLKTKDGGVDFRVTVTRTIMDGTRMNGIMDVSLSGTESNQEKVYTLNQLTSDKKPNYRLGFKNFQEVKQSLLLPKGFAPEKIIIYIAPKNSEIEELTEEFDWKELAGKSKTKKS